MTEERAGRCMLSRVKSAGFALLALLGSARLLAGETVTFTKHIAPLVFERCAACHRPGGTAPFSLLTYTSARQHAQQIAALDEEPPHAAVESRVGVRRLRRTASADRCRDRSHSAMGRGRRGRRGFARSVRRSRRLRTGGSSVNPISSSRFRAVHAAGPTARTCFASSSSRCRWTKCATSPDSSSIPATRASCITPTSASIGRATSRRLDEEDPAPGYDGLLARSAMYPDGHFLGWTPGQVAPLLPKGLAWRLAPDTDLVVEIHMQPSGKPEVVQPSVGLFFGSDPPERTPMMLRLGRQNIDIPAGEKHYTITDSFVLPVDVEVQARSAARALPRARDQRHRDAAGRHDENADPHQRLGLPLAARVPLRHAVLRCRKGRRWRCGTRTTTRRTIRATRCSRPSAFGGDSDPTTRWATCGFRC